MLQNSTHKLGEQVLRLNVFLTRQIDGQEGKWLIYIYIITGSIMEILYDILFHCEKQQ